MQFKSFFKIFINENWNKRSSSKDFRKILTKYANVPDAMYSFRSYVNKSAGLEIQKINPSIGINPKNRYSTPTGIYGYPVEETLDKALINKLEFASDRPILVVYKPKKNVFVVRASTFSKDQLREKKFFLANLLNTSFEHIQEIADLYIDSAYKKTPAQELWSLTRSLAKQNVNAWAKLLVDLGCPIFIDDIGSGFIHPSEPTQCVVFGKQFVDVLEQVENLKLTPETNEQDDVLSNLYIEINNILKAPVRREGDNELIEKFARKKNALLINMQPFTIEQKLKLWERIFISTSLPIENLKVERTALKLETNNRPEVFEIIKKILGLSNKSFSVSVNTEVAERQELFLEFLLESLDLNSNIGNLIFLLETVGFDLRYVKKSTSRSIFERIMNQNWKNIINYLENYFEENSTLNIEKDIGKLVFLTKNSSAKSDSILNILSRMTPGNIDLINSTLKSISWILDFLQEENKNWKTDLEKENKKVYDKIKKLIEKYFNTAVKRYFYESQLTIGELSEQIVDNDDTGSNTHMEFIKRMIKEFPFDDSCSTVLFNLVTIDNILYNQRKDDIGILDITEIGKTLKQKLMDENLTSDFVKILGKGFMEMLHYHRERGGNMPRIMYEFNNYGIFNDDELKNFLTTENLKELINFLYNNSGWFESLADHWQTKGENHAEKLIYSLENNLYSWANPMVENHMGYELFTKQFIIKLMLNNKEKILENIKDEDFKNGYEFKI